MLQKMEEMHVKSADLIRSYSNIVEYRTVVDKNLKVKAPIRCNMCKLSVYGNINKHRTSELHLRLKSFLHPICDSCNREFERRIDWDQHR